MFIDSKYTTWYFNIVEAASSRLMTEGEKHHIIPRSLGGTNNKENIVKLTYREHFICHWLLTKMVVGSDKNKMCYALHCMGRSSRFHEREMKAWQKQLTEKYNRKKRPSINKGKITVRDNNGKVFHVTRDDPRWISGEICHVSKGTKRNWTKEEVDLHYASRRGRPKTEEWLEKVRGREPWNKGLNNTRTWSEEEKTRRLKTVNRNKKARIVCPHCHKVGGEPAMKRWHFDNCKEKNG